MADTVEKQDFNLNPHTFMGSIPIFAANFALAAITSVLAYIFNIVPLFFISDFLILLGYGIVVAEYVFYLQFLEEEQYLNFHLRLL